MGFLLRVGIMLSRFGEGRVMKMAGLYDCWRDDDDKPMYSFTILTTDSSKRLQWCDPYTQLIRRCWEAVLPQSQCLFAPLLFPFMLQVVLVSDFPSAKLPTSPLPFPPPHTHAMATQRPSTSLSGLSHDGLVDMTYP